MFSRRLRSTSLYNFHKNFHNEPFINRSSFRRTNGLSDGRRWLSLSACSHWWLSWVRTEFRNSLGFNATRFFACRASKDANNNFPLVNEKLISALVNQSRSTADGIQVRVIAELNGEGATSKVVSLSEAIQISVQNGLDLIG